MQEPEILYDVLVFLVAAVVVVPLLRRLRLSPILGFLTAGIIIGPHGFALIRDAEGAQALGEFGVVFLLFMIGLELSVARLRLLSRYVFGLGPLQVGLTGALIGGAAWAAGADAKVAIVIGSGLALSSTAFVLQLLAERGESSTRPGQLSFAILLFQDLIIVPLLILLPLIARDESALVPALGVAGFQTAAALIGVMVFGRLVLRPVYRIIAGTGSADLFVVVSLLVVLGTSWAVSQAGLSMALGAFLAGLLLAETEYRHQVEADLRPFRGVLLGLFFMSIGMWIDIGFVIDNWGRILAAVAGLLVAKAAVILTLCRVVGFPVAIAGSVGLLLAQGGEFGFVLFGLATRIDLLAPDTTQLLFAVVTVSMAVTPALAFLAGRLSQILAERVPQDLSRPAQEVGELTDHVVVVGFGRVGQAVGQMLAGVDLPYVALDRDHALVADCRARGSPVFYGDAGSVAVLRAAGAGRAKAAVITIDQPATASRAVAALRESFPDLQVFVRSRDMRHSRLLEESGAAAVVPDTLEASLQLGGIVLRSMGKSSAEIDSVLDDLRQDDYAKLQETVTAQGDDP